MLCFNPLMPGMSSLPESQRRIYAKEKNFNFRSISQHFASISPYTLTSADLASSDLKAQLSEIGQFAELAHGRLRPQFIWDHMDHLLQPGFPLEGYNALRDSTFISTFHGVVARLQGYVAYRTKAKQLVVAFTGTSSAIQRLHNADLRHVLYPSGEGATVHSGFWKMYQGVKEIAMDKLTRGLSDYDVDEILLTGHSLGAVMCYLFAFDVIGEAAQRNISVSIPLKIAVFGSPRIGNEALVTHWRKTVPGRSSFREYSVRGFNDGITTLPPYILNFRHFASKPLYSIQGLLYEIPESQSEYTAFLVDHSDGYEATPPSLEHPLGGHNYYNGRDMEKLLRSMDWFSSLKSDTVDWEEYSRWLQEREG